MTSHQENKNRPVTVCFLLILLYFQQFQHHKSCACFTQIWLIFPISYYFTFNREKSACILTYGQKTLLDSLKFEHFPHPPMLTRNLTATAIIVFSIICSQIRSNKVAIICYHCHVTWWLHIAFCRITILCWILSENRYM